MSLTTPADRAAAHADIARKNLDAAVRIANTFIHSSEHQSEVKEAAWACRLLLVGAITDSEIGSTRARHYARTAMRDVMHDGTRSRGVVAVYRRCLNALDGKPAA